MVTDKREFQTVTLAALLRSVVHHLPEGADFTGEWHEYFSRCVDGDLFRAIVQPTGEATDARARPLLSLVDLAETLASSRPVRQRGQAPRPSAGALMPIFDTIELTERQSPKPRFFPLQALSDTTEPLPIFADEESPQAEMGSYIHKFAQQMGQLRERLDWSSFDCVYTHFLSLLNAYAWCIPAGGESEATHVSLYDHCCVTSAIAACLHRFHSANNNLNDAAIAARSQTRCILLTGDLSGIQDYIFSISNIGAGGVAKRLRARSFFVQLLSDAASLRVLREFQLPIANILMASGGKFYILLPGLPTAPDALKKLQYEFDDWMLRTLHGELAVNLAWVPLADSDFAPGKYGEALTRLHAKLQQRKVRRLAEVLQDESGWRQEFIRERFQGDSVCEACRRFPATEFSQDRNRADGADICAQCNRQVELGRKLTRAKFISFHADDMRGDVSCLGMSVSVGDEPSSDAFLAVRLNSPEVRNWGHVPATFRYLANHVPNDNGVPWAFEDIAAQRKLGKGETTSALLGVLKADVDYLGQIFQEGLRRDVPEHGLDTVSHIAALSRQMDWFFSGWLEWLLTNKYERCYCVYSGGDDLLIVGPRTQALELAKTIREDFARYTRHPEITLSAGIAVVKPRLPLAHTVKQADAALERAKEAGRNRLCLMKDTVTWGELPLIEHAIAILEHPNVSSAFHYQLLQFAGMWRRFAEGDVLGLRYQPLLANTIARNLNERKQPELYQWARGLVGFPLPPAKTSQERIMEYLGLIARWVIIGRRDENAT